MIPRNVCDKVSVFLYRTFLPAAICLSGASLPPQARTTWELLGQLLPG